MGALLLALWLGVMPAAAVVYPAEARHRWASFGGALDYAVTVAAVLVWPAPLIVAAWLWLYRSYVAHRWPTHAEEEENHGS